MNAIEKVKAENPDLYKVMAVVTRKSGATETLDLSARFTGMTADLAKRIAAATATKGDKVERIYRKEIDTNIGAIEREWNRINNEGGEGYVPDMSNDPRVYARVKIVDFL